MTIPVKPLSEIEVKQEVSENDKILILDSDTEEARLAPKDEIKGEDGRDGTDAWQYMTQDEYNRLPSSKNTDHISRMIYDDIEVVFKVLLRENNNLLHYNNLDELYADLQFENGLTPVSVFPIGVNVGIVSKNDGWQENGLLLNARTENSYMRILCGEDGKIYIDSGNGIFKTLATNEDISEEIQSLRSELSEVAFSGKSSDLDNDAGFNSVPVLTPEEYENIPGTSSDDKRYFTYDTITE